MSTGPLNLVIPYATGSSHGWLRPETKELGERLGARFVHMPRDDSYRNLVAELWAADKDFILLEEDILPTEDCIRRMWACTEEWCTGHHGRWSVGLNDPGCPGIPDHPLASTEEGARIKATDKDPIKPCGEPPGRCGQRDMTPERFARIQACSLRQARRQVNVVRSDSWIGLVKFGSIRLRVPDLMARAERHIPDRHWRFVDQKIFRVLYGEEGSSPHLHFPHMIQLKEGGPQRDYKDPWDSLEDGKDAPGCYWA